MTRTTLSVRDANLFANRVGDYRGGPKGSFYQTCLWGQSRDNEKIQDKFGTTLDALNQGLASDEAKFHQKYSAGIRKGEGEAPLQGSARRWLEIMPSTLSSGSNYTIELPQSGSNIKLSDDHIMRKKFEEGEGLAKTMKRVRFNMPTLKAWFYQIDADKSGEISVPELVNFLRSNKDLEQVMLLASATEGASGGRRESTGQNRRASHERKLVAKRNQELKRMIKICTEMDVDGSGAMDMSEFIDFFRRTGYLLEYDSTMAIGRVPEAPPPPPPREGELSPRLGSKRTRAQ